MWKLLAKNQFLEQRLILLIVFPEKQLCHVIRIEKTWIFLRGRVTRLLENLIVCLKITEIK